MGAIPTLRTTVRKAAPSLLKAADELCECWLKSTIEKVRDDPRQFRPKQINDPIWGTVELRPAEVALLDSPLLQRMRGVKQLGLAPLVFPSASHDRFEHIIGVVGAVDRIVDALNRQIERWNGEKEQAGEAVSPILLDDRRALRLAAIFHDLGHGPFSHAIEPVLDVAPPLGALDATEVTRWRQDIAELRKELMAAYSLNSKPATSELLAIAFVMSAPVGELLSMPMFSSEKMSGADLQARIAACIIGGLEGPGATHLSTLISGQIDADRLDYLARDAHHAGLEIAFDTHRLLSKLEVLQVRDANLKNSDNDLRKRIERSEHGVFYEVGIAAAGYGSFELMLIGRTFLYDRLYHHHKVRAAEAMAQRMLLVAERDRKQRFELAEIFQSIGDDTFIRVIAQEIQHPSITVQSEAAARLAKGILSRELLHRAFAFRGRLIGSPPGLEDATALANRDRQWRDVVKATGNLQGRYELGVEIHRVALEIADALIAGGKKEEGEFYRQALEKCGPELVIADLPGNKADAIRILARYPDGSLKAPEFSFNPHKWTEAYEQQKRTGYVFCPKECVPAIALASRIVFLQRFGIALGEDADGYIKVEKATEDSWLAVLVKARLLDAEVAATLTTKRYSLLRVREDDLALPSEWIENDPDLAAKLVAPLNRYLRGGLTMDGLEALKKTLESLWRFVDKWFAGPRVTGELASERELQEAVADHLRATLDVEEGTKVGGGELDLFVGDHVLIENKFKSAQSNPANLAKSAGMQGRRYTLALRGQVIIVISAYRHKKGEVVPNRSGVVSVQQVTREDGNRAEIRISLPFGCPKPSSETPEMET